MTERPFSFYTVSQVQQHALTGETMVFLKPNPAMHHPSDQPGDLIVNIPRDAMRDLGRAMHKAREPGLDELQEPRGR